MSSHAAAPSGLPALRPRTVALTGVGAGAPLTLGVGLVLAAVSFAARSGLSLGATTRVELGLTLGSGLVGAAALLSAPRRGPWFGTLAAGLFIVLAGWTALSITWAVDPSAAWVEANRTITYAAVFAGALALARVAPGQWSSVLYGVILAAVVVCGYALLGKVLPGSIAPDEPYARLRAPFDYWNATGLMAALGVIPCLWLGSRREGHSVVNALAVPALGVLFATLLLAYSRGATLALIVGLAFWLITVPLRLRAVAVLATALVLTLPVVLFAFSRPALTENGVSLSARSHSGALFGVALMATLLALWAAGLALGFVRAARGKRPDRARRRTGAALLVILALVPVGLAVGLAFSHRGLFGSVSHAVTTLTDTDAKLPKNDPSRLTSVGSVRARYWSEAIHVFRAHPTDGVGAGSFGVARLRYRHDLVQVQHAHGYVVQTLADLGWIGMALSLVLLAAWLAAARLSLGLRRVDRGRPFAPERRGMFTLAAVVLVFGAHSTIDWTWFVPGTAVTALLCAGWVAGRGPLRDPSSEAPEPLRLRPRLWRRDQPAMFGAAALIVVALMVAWAAFQPLRAQNAVDNAYAALGNGDAVKGATYARTANFRNPLDIEPLNALAVAQARANDVQGAKRTLLKEVRLQPGNPVTWRRLADFQLSRLDDPKGALQSLKAALYLDPRNPQIIGPYLGVARQLAATNAAK